MSRVTDIREGKRGLCYLHLDGEYALSVYPDILAQQEISLGSELDAPALSRLAEAQERLFAKRKAVELLGYGDCSEKALFDKLTRRKLSPEAAAEAVSYCVSQGFADDRRTGKALLKSLLSGRGYGERRAREAMALKGYDRALIGELLEEENDDPLARLSELLARQSEALADPRQQERLIGKYLRKGYSYSDIRAAMARVSDFPAEEFS